MNTNDEAGLMYKLKIPRELYEEIGSQEKTNRVIRAGLLSLRTTSVEKEIADIIKGAEDQKKRIAELPSEIERFQRLLVEALKDRKTLERLLDKKG